MEYGHTRRKTEKTDRSGNGCTDTDRYRQADRQRGRNTWSRPKKTMFTSETPKVNRYT